MAFDVAFEVLFAVAFVVVFEALVLLPCVELFEVVFVVEFVVGLDEFYEFPPPFKMPHILLRSPPPELEDDEDVALVELVFVALVAVPLPVVFVTLELFEV